MRPIVPSVLFVGFIFGCTNSSNPGDPQEQYIDELLLQMSLVEKVAQLSGPLATYPNCPDINTCLSPMRGLWVSQGVPRLSVPGLRFSDGPRGLTATNSLFGAREEAEATAFPVAMARGATWDIALEEKVGEAIGLEVKAWGGDVVLAPALNILTHPAWGRAQETYSEDTHHLGEMGVAFINGAQKHVIANAKHFAVNNIEDTRMTVNAVVDERTLREVYLPHFKKAVVDARVGSIMTAYNKVNGKYCSENSHLLNDVLKGEWGFDGFVISDWFTGTRSTVDAVNSGLDLEMPLPEHFGAKLIEATTKGLISEERIDDSIRRVLRISSRLGLLTNEREIDLPVLGKKEHRDLALEVARKSMVLLKNKNSTLPLKRAMGSSIAVVGTFANIGRMGDNGSSAVDAGRVVTPLVGIQEVSGITEVHHINSDTLSTEDETLLKMVDAVIVVVGLTPADEGEAWNGGGDRETLRLRAEHELLIERVSELNPSSVVVIEAGSAITMESWHNQVGAILMAWYPGQEGGTAVGEILFGDVNPSGKLPISFPMNEAQLAPFADDADEFHYSYFHGYRFLEQEGKEPLYAFGHGMSYTQYKYKNFVISKDSIGLDGEVEVSVDIENSGNQQGDEIVQLYVGYRGSSVSRAVKDLKGFHRITLAPKEVKTVVFTISARDLAYYDVDLATWTVEKISYEVSVGSSSEDIRADLTFQIQ